jgi:hypothetical protein
VKEMPRLTKAELSDTVNQQAAEIARLHAENMALQRQIEALQQKVPTPRNKPDIGQRPCVEVEHCPICWKDWGELHEGELDCLPCGHQMCYKCKEQHLKLRNDCPVCRAPAPQLDALAARNEAIARGSYNFHGQRWPEIGEIVVVRTSVSVLVGLVHGYSGKHLLLKYGSSMWEIDLWWCEVCTAQYLVDMLPQQSDEPGYTFREIRNSAAFTPENFW